jgi:hypothetical protein
MTNPTLQSLLDLVPPELLQMAPAEPMALATASSVLLGATIGLLIPFFKRALAWILAFAAGTLISAFFIKLAHQAAQGMRTETDWALVVGGFVLGGIVYYWCARALDNKGAVVRHPGQFHKYALALRKFETKELINLLPKCDLLRHLPPEKAGDIVPFIQRRYLNPQDVLFRAGDRGDALYIVARGKVEVLEPSATGARPGEHSITELEEGSAFGEMALLTGGPRTATVRAVTQTDLLQLDKADFEQMIAADHELAKAAYRISHERATYNLRTGGPNLSTWTDIANSSMSYLSRGEENKILARTGLGAAWPIVVGNLLDFIPGCALIGATLAGPKIIAYSLMLGIFLGGIPIAAASAGMLRRAGYGALKIYGIWLIVPIVGAAAVGAGKLWLGGAASPASIFAEAAAASAVLGLAAREMIPESLDQGGASIVLPLIAGLLFATFVAPLI